MDWCQGSMPVVYQYIEVYEYQLSKFPYPSSSELSSIPIGFFLYIFSSFHPITCFTVNKLYGKLNKIYFSNETKMCFVIEHVKENHINSDVFWSNQYIYVNLTFVLNSKFPLEIVINVWFWIFSTQCHVCFWIFSYRF